MTCSSSDADAVDAGTSTDANTDACFTFVTSTAKNITKGGGMTQG
jgi:hypothetical protein